MTPLDHSQAGAPGGAGEGLDPVERRRWLLLLAMRAITLTFVAILALLVLRAPWMRDPTTVGTDTSNYFAAAQRLDDGHPLYRLGPGDLPVGMSPEFGTIALVSSPPIAVLWRPLGYLPRAVAIWMWWSAMVIAVVVTVVWLSGTRSLVMTAAVALLAWDLVITALSGNVNALLVPLLCAVWLAYKSGRAALLGSLVAAAVGLKLLPIVLVVWLAASRRWEALRWFAVSAAALGLVSLLGAGLQNHIDWLAVARTTGTSALSDQTLAGVLHSVGLPSEFGPLVIPMVLAVGCVAILALSNHPGAGFAVAIVTMMYANPALHSGSAATLLPALMPLAFPLKRETHQQAQVNPPAR